MGIAHSVKNLMINGLGTKTKYKLVAFLVDDYGGVRTKNKAAVEAFRKAGMMGLSRYLNDTLASKEDLIRLFEVLTSVKDSRGHYACFTPLTNIANPDFECIKESDYTTYYREPFTKTLAKYGMADAFDLWKQGIENDIFHPEYHGTEHIDIRSFISALKAGHKSSMLAFENESTACPLLPGETQIGYSTKTFHIIKAIENESLKKDIKTGIEMFREIFGYNPSIFTPGACEYSPALHGCLAENGIKYLDVQRYKAYPMGDGKFQKRFLYNGKKSEYDQWFFVRNVAFEPICDDSSHFEGSVDYSLRRIEDAFAYGCPAIVSSHRANFVSGIEPAQGEFGLAKLKELLNGISKRWPDVMFVNGRDMFDVVFERKEL